MKLKRWILLVVGLLIIGFAGLITIKKVNVSINFSVGEQIDSLNGVYVYHNGGVDNISGRNKTSDGYNLGLKYQCVEFVKRYYYEHLNHKMPETYGHAKDFFITNLSDGKRNTQRNLIQYTNPSGTKPKADDLLIFEGSTFNKFGHVAIVSQVTDMNIEIIQQNSGPLGRTRETIKIEYKNGKWEIKESRILGWLRKE